MGARGRHRRRKRGRALRAALAGAALGLTAAATMISASQATVSSDPGALKPLTSASALGKLELRETLEPQRSLDRLASAMGRPVGVDTVLKSADHTLRDAADCTADEKAALPVEPAATRAYCWDSGDAADPAWTPRSVTTSGDADEDGWWGSNRVILSGWSANSGGLAKVAFVNADDPGRLTYTWALLAVPTDGGRDYRGLVSKVSGMVWYEDKLLVTTSSGTRDALYVYDMNRIQRATVTASAVGRVREGWSAAGYRYVLPAVGSYRLTGDSSATGPVGLSLDRSTVPDSLVASGGKQLWRYPFSRDPARPGLLATDSARHAVPEEAYATKVPGVGGVLAYGSSWYLSGAAREQSGHGSLWRQDAKDARDTECGADETHQCWSPGTDSLSYWQETGEVWSVSGRMLFALPLTSIDRALD
ncbi:MULTISPECIES: hypothetical protein [unclassified Streptomyces]|uniref:hypothetical protein n=1 Tax=unclassified Streptomyces TaxID=2593676 RepID=UPI00190AFFB7|nr:MULTISPECIES: hypothetical protein [unclassified Streptomyces]MBK3565836.1 hypothetical protein [Streptomyces sp. MBT62]MBK6011624.1 hypothetical protein [Streptomyces sp. MBT53]